jgi:hypothetical protein
MVRTGDPGDSTRIRIRFAIVVDSRGAVFQGSSLIPMVKLAQATSGRSGLFSRASSAAHADVVVPSKPTDTFVATVALNALPNLVDLRRIHQLTDYRSRLEKAFGRAFTHSLKDHTVRVEEEENNGELGRQPLPLLSSALLLGTFRAVADAVRGVATTVMGLAGATCSDTAAFVSFFTVGIPQSGRFPHHVVVLSTRSSAFSHSLVGDEVILGRILSLRTHNSSSVQFLNNRLESYSLVISDYATGSRTHRQKKPVALRKQKQQVITNGRETRHPKSKFPTAEPTTRVAMDELPPPPVSDSAPTVATPTTGP